MNKPFSIFDNRRRGRRRSRNSLAAPEFLLEIPQGFDWILGTVFHTCVYSAWHVLHTAGRIRRNDVVLLHSAAGAIGAMSAQIAKSAGATVIGLCSPAKFDFARSYGVDHPFDSSDPDWPAKVLEATDGHGADLIIDGIWKAPISEIVDLEDTPDLHRRFEARELIGRNLIRVGGELDEG